MFNTRKIVSIALAVIVAICAICVVTAFAKKVDFKGKLNDLFDIEQTDNTTPISANSAKITLASASSYNSINATNTATLVHAPTFTASNGNTVTYKYYIVSKVVTNGNTVSSMTLVDDTMTTATDGLHLDGNKLEITPSTAFADFVGYEYITVRLVVSATGCENVTLDLPVTNLSAITAD